MKQTWLPVKLTHIAIITVMVLLAVMVPFSGVLPKRTAASARVTGTNDRLYINTFGGQDGTTGADGLAIVINGTGSDTLTGSRRDAPDPESDQIWFANTPQWCCSG